MIKLSSHIYIHWLTVAVFAAAYITRTLEITAMMYSVMLLHELSHAVAALYLRLGISRIILYPFGVSLTLKTRLLCSLSDNLILYLAGPLVNAAVAAVSAALFGINLFAVNNIAVFALNLLPILPLDGGNIADALLRRFFGERASGRVMVIISVLFSAAVTVLFVLTGNINTNTVTLSAFILGGCVMNKPKYNRDFIKELAFSENKSGIKSDVFLVDFETPKRKIAAEFSPKKRAVVLFADKSGTVKSIKTDKEVIFDILN